MEIALIKHFAAALFVPVHSAIYDAYIYTILCTHVCMYTYVHIVFGIWITR